MTEDEIEDEPFKRAEDMEPTRVPLKGPNVISTLDTPPHPDAVRAQDAAIRKHLQDRRPQQDRPEDPEAQDSKG
jgi:hypothetical protein